MINLQTIGPPQKAGSVKVQAISGTKVSRVVRMSARERWTRKKFIRESWKRRFILANLSSSIKNLKAVRQNQSTPQRLFLLVGKVGQLN